MKKKREIERSCETCRYLISLVNPEKTLYYCYWHNCERIDPKDFLTYCGYWEPPEGEEKAAEKYFFQACGNCRYCKSDLIMTSDEWGLRLRCGCRKAYRFGRYVDENDICQRWAGKEKPRRK